MKNDYDVIIGDYIITLIMYIRKYYVITSMYEQLRNGKRLWRHNRGLRNNLNYEFKVLYLGLSIWATCSVNDKTHMINIGPIFDGFR